MTERRLSGVLGGEAGGKAREGGSGGLVLLLLRSCRESRGKGRREKDDYERGRGVVPRPPPTDVFSASCAFFVNQVRSYFFRHCSTKDRLQSLLARS